MLWLGARPVAGGRPGGHGDASAAAPSVPHVRRRGGALHPHDFEKEVKSGPLSILQLSLILRGAHSRGVASDDVDNAGSPNGAATGLRASRENTGRLSWTTICIEPDFSLHELVELAGPCARAPLAAGLSTVVNSCGLRFVWITLLILRGVRAVDDCDKSCDDATIIMCAQLS